jgi:hypothetical protein
MEGVCAGVSLLIHCSIRILFVHFLRGTDANTIVIWSQSHSDRNLNMCGSHRWTSFWDDSKIFKTNLWSGKHVCRPINGGELSSTPNGFLFSENGSDCGTSSPRWLLRDKGVEHHRYDQMIQFASGLGFRLERFSNQIFIILRTKPGKKGISTFGFAVRPNRIVKHRRLQQEHINFLTINFLSGIGAVGGGLGFVWWLILVDSGPQR